MAIIGPLRRAYKEFCAQIEPEYFVTLATNGDGTVNRARHLAKAYCARMDRKLLGHNWHELPASQRTDGIFFVEHTRSNIHLHGLLRFPGGAPKGLEMTTGLVWKALCAKGSIDVSPIPRLSSLVDYCLKETRFAGYDDGQIILVRELMSEAAHQTI